MSLKDLTGSINLRALSVFLMAVALLCGAFSALPSVPKQVKNKVLVGSILLEHKDDIKKKNLESIKLEMRGGFSLFSKNTHWTLGDKKERKYGPMVVFIKAGKPDTLVIVLYKLHDKYNAKTFDKIVNDGKDEDKWFVLRCNLDDLLKEKKFHSMLKLKIEQGIEKLLSLEILNKENYNPASVRLSFK